MKMLKNNNQQVIKRMAKTSFFRNKGKNLVLVCAVFLAVFMLFSIFTVGLTYVKMEKRQNIRLSGEDMDAIMYGMTKEQVKKCENSSEVSKIGKVGVAGYAISTQWDDTLHTGLIYSDKTYWDEIMAPARKETKGHYPKQEDEVMVTQTALEDCGLSGLGIGDTFTLTYGDNNGTEPKEKTFKICGIWDGYGTKKVFFVSKKFYQQSGYQLSDVRSGRMYLQFKSKILTTKKQEEFREQMDLGVQQALFFTAETSNSVRILRGMVGLAFITCLSAYLLIYNILYLSVSGNIRYYGLLQTVGMTGTQVKNLMKRQMCWIGIFGIGGGLFAGVLTSFFIIPEVVRSLGIREKVVVAFHPGIILLTILIAVITLLLGSRKPVKIACAVTPMEALGYRTVTSSRKAHRTKRGHVLKNMACRQLKKDKKKTAVVFLSLATGLSVFLVLITLIESQGARTIVSNYMDADMEIVNDTLMKEDTKDWKPILDSNFTKKIENISGVKEVHQMTSAKIFVPWEDDFADTWMRAVYEMWMSEPYEQSVEDYKAHPEKYYSYLKGIDEAEFENLNSMFQKKVNKKDFMEGRVCILYRNGVQLKEKEMLGKELTCLLPENSVSQGKCTFQIAGVTDDNRYAGIGLGPNLIVSEKWLEQVVKNPFVQDMTVLYDEEYDTQTEQAVIKAIQSLSDSRDVSYESKIEEMENVKKAQGNMKGVGIGITLILAFIGLMNYINTVSGSIQNRQVELSVMESVGMTDRQVYRMLVYEGLFYAGGSILLTGTVGLLITYLCYQSMNYRGIAFSVPILPVSAAVLLVLAVCVAVPVLAYRLLAGRHSVVERIRGFE